jgi:hypothetical protein
VWVARCRRQPRKPGSFGLSPLPHSLLLSSGTTATAWLGMEEAACVWLGASGSLGGQVPPPPSPLLSGGGKVHGVDDEFMAVTSGSSEVVVGTCGLARGQCYDDATGGGDWA